jgi:large subunit ribosomal protein L21
MYGIVEIAGHQYRVQPGDLIDVEKLTADAGSVLKIDKVLFIGGDKTLIGAPLLAGAAVTVKVLKHDKGEKLTWMKRKPGKYLKRKGHRQQYTALLVTELADGKGGVLKIEKDSKNAKKFLK